MILKLVRAEVMVRVRVRLVIVLDLGFGLGLGEIQTPLIQFLWTCCGFAVDASICCGFVYSLLYSKSTTNRISGDVDTASRCVHVDFNG